jgi:Transcriptional regulatory protein, C terminal
MPSDATDATIALAGFSFEAARLELLDATGAPVPLRAQALAVLGCLARRRGHVVTRDELMRAVWGATWWLPTAALRSASTRFVRRSATARIESCRPCPNAATGWLPTARHQRQRPDSSSPSVSRLNEAAPGAAGYLIRLRLVLRPLSAKPLKLPV